MRTRRSNFVSKSGLIFLAAIVFIAAYFKLTVLTALVGLVLFIAAISYAWAKLSVSKIDAKIDSSAAYAFPGEILDAEVTVTNNKAILLMWMELVFPHGSAKCIAEDYVENFSWVMPHQKIVWNIQIPAVKRGVCKINNLLVRSGDGLGLGEEESKVEIGDFSLVVYPTVKSVDPQPLLRNISELEPSRSGLQQDRTLLNNIRPYHDGDSFKDINWRLMARSGEVYSNVHEKLAMRRVCFIPDFESFSYVEIVEDRDGKHEEFRCHESEFEEMLSMIASYISALDKQDVICTLAIPSQNEGKATLIIPEERDGQIVELLSALAEISYEGGPAPLPLYEMENERHLLGQIYKYDYINGLQRSVGGEYEKV